MHVILLVLEAGYAISSNILCVVQMFMRSIIVRLKCTCLHEHTCIYIYIYIYISSCLIVSQRTSNKSSREVREGTGSFEP